MGFWRQNETGEAVRGSPAQDGIYLVFGVYFFVHQSIIPCWGQKGYIKNAHIGGMNYLLRRVFQYLWIRHGKIRMRGVGR